MVDGLQQMAQFFTYLWIQKLCYGTLQYFPTLGEVLFPIPSFWAWTCNFLPIIE